MIQIIFLRDPYGNSDIENNDKKLLGLTLPYLNSDKGMTSEKIKSKKQDFSPKGR